MKTSKPETIDIAKLDKVTGGCGGGGGGGGWEQKPQQRGGQPGGMQVV